MVENLVIGRGFLGEKLVSLMKKKGFEVKATANTAYSDTVALDITNKELTKSFFKKIKPENVFLLASIGNVDECEISQDRAMLLNYHAVESIAELCKKHKSKLFFLSTDYVFDGSQGNYKENDRKTPINFYGLTKDLAERAVADLEGSVIIRSSSFYGFNSWNDKKSFPVHVIESLGNEKEFFALRQKTSPTLIDDLAAGLIQLKEKDFSGVVHVAGPSPLSRFQTALAVVEAFELNKGLVRECDEESELELIAKRPLDSSLCIEKANSLGIKMRDFALGLKEMRNQMENLNLDA